ncbi:MAG: pseudouridine synthase [Phycisphaerales bacterium JB061]
MTSPKPRPPRKPRKPRKQGNDDRPAYRGSPKRTNKAPGKPYGSRRERLPRELDIIHEDADILIVNKPAGIVSAMPKPGSRPTLYDMVKQYARAKGGRDARAFVVHRLDLDASGLLIFAKSKPALDWLKDDLRARRIDRHYIALVDGEVAGGKDATGTVQSLLREEPGGHVVEVPDQRYRGSRGDASEARPAVTHYRVLGVGKGHSLVQLKLETGRKHQIRVHMASLGHPLVGDVRYGKGASRFNRLALHASELAFRHPGSGQRVRYFCPAPAEFYEAAGLQPAKAITPSPGETAPIVKRESPKNRPAGDAGWDEVSEWYGEYQTSGRSDHFAEVIVPGTVGLLAPKPGERVLDIACGEGRLADAITNLGASVTGVDASPALIDLATKRKLAGSRFAVGDARKLGELPQDLRAEPFDAATCVMALMNINPISDVLDGASKLLRSGGRFVAVILHPAFRSPARSSWGWEGERASKQKQYRRVDAYLSAAAEPIIMNPGEVASGGKPVQTLTHHRPLEHYVKAFGAAGLMIDDLEEWPSRRRSEPGPRADEENRARREIPMFLCIRAVKA